MRTFSCAHRLLPVFMCLLVGLTGCDSGDDSEQVAPPSIPSAVVGLLVTDPDGDPVSGLSASLQYEFLDAEAGGDRSAGRPSAVLNTAFPNPFATVAVLGLDVSTVGSFTIEAADLDGRPLATIAERTFAVGSYQVLWEPAAETFPDGVYVVRLVQQGEVLGSRLVLRLTDYDGFPSRTLTAKVALGVTGAEGTLAFDDGARFPQLYDAEFEYRDENNTALGVLTPSDAVTIVLRDGGGREQRYARTLSGEVNPFQLTWDPE